MKDAKGIVLDYGDYFTILLTGISGIFVNNPPPEPLRPSLRGGWCLLLAVYAPFTRPLRSVYARVRSVCAPCTLRVRSVYASVYIRVRSVYIRVRSVYIRVTCGLHQGHLRFKPGLPA